MKTILKNIATAIVLVSLFAGTAHGGRARRDTSLATVIKGRLAVNADKLNYPASVKRFYVRGGFKPVWLLADSAKKVAWDAMLLLECVAQYGLNTADYRPHDLNCSALNAVAAGKANNSNRAAFDIKMTDAIITLIYNLHYGKLNPQFGQSRVDAANTAEFKADYALADALEWNTLEDMITGVQPQTEAYTNLQHHMLLLATRFTGPNRISPEHDMRKMAINMERLRWMYTTGKPMHLTCTVLKGVLIYGKDVDMADKKLEQKLYYPDIKNH
jgi:murein L,D-transpeptidase YcbB/YkuD